jgi:hypothetical protein
MSDMDQEASRAFVSFKIVMPSAVMVDFEKQMRLDGIEPDPKTRRMPFDKAITGLLRAYADGRVVIVDTKKPKKATAAGNQYIVDHAPAKPITVEQALANAKALDLDRPVWDLYSHPYSLGDDIDVVVQLQYGATKEEAGKPENQKRYRIVATAFEVREV